MKKRRIQAVRVRDPLLGAKNKTKPAQRGNFFLHEMWWIYFQRSVNLSETSLNPKIIIQAVWVFIRSPQVRNRRYTESPNLTYNDEHQNSGYRQILPFGSHAFRLSKFILFFAEHADLTLSLPAKLLSRSLLGVFMPSSTVLRLLVAS